MLFLATDLTGGCANVLDDNVEVDASISVETPLSSGQ
jgi:hypothetical protein